MGKATVMSNDNGKSDVNPAESQIIRTVGSFSHGNREMPETSVSSETDRSEQVQCRNADVYVSGKSDSFVVPKKRANKTGLSTVAESVEGRRLTKENIRYIASAPDTEPTRRKGGLSGVRTTVLGIVGPSLSKVGAGCGSSARPDLCGGWPARAIPTAIRKRFEHRTSIGWPPTECG